GFGRSGRAAAEALLASRESVRVWDPEPQSDAAGERDELERRGVALALGGDGRDLLDLGPEPRCLVKSPGLPFDSALVAAAIERGLEVIDEAELGWRIDGRPVVGITGTNGKSTSAALLCAALSA